MRAKWLLLTVMCGCATATSVGTTPTSTSNEPQPGSTMTADQQVMLQQASLMAQSMAAAQRSASVSCDPIATRVVGLDEERAVGKHLVVPLLEQEGPLVGAQHAELVKWVAGVGQLLAQRSSRPQLQWTFGVIQNEKPFTASTPGGYVFVTTGLLARLKNEAQLAGVLAHEISHVALRHGVKSYTSALSKQCQAAATARAMLASNPSALAMVPEDTREALKLLDGAVDLSQEGSFGAHLVRVVWLLDRQTGHDASDEAATDGDAAHLLAFTGYDAVEYEKFLLELGDLRGHPPAADRVARLKALREGELNAFIHATYKPDVTARVAGLRSAP